MSSCTDSDVSGNSVDPALHAPAALSIQAISSQKSLYQCGHRWVALSAIRPVGFSNKHVPFLILNTQFTYKHLCSLSFLAADFILNALIEAIVRQ